MKRKMKVVLTLFMVLLMFSFTMVVSSAATTVTNTNMAVHKINGSAMPLSQVKGLPENSYINEFCDGDNYVACLGEDYGNEDDWDDDKIFVGYSRDGVNFNIVLESDIENSLGISSFDIVGYEGIRYEEGYFVIVISYDVDMDYGGLFTIRTKNFVDWEYRDYDEGIETPDYIEYWGEYNGYHIACDGYVFDNTSEQVSIKYYISQDGKNWTEKHTPAMNLEIRESPKFIYGEHQIDIMVTSFGVVFYTHYNQVVDYPTVVTTHTDFYITKDFNTYTKIDASALGGCKGGLEENLAHYDNVYLKRTAWDKKLVLIRDYGDYSFEENTEYGFFETEVLNGTIELYTFDEKTNSFVLDFKAENADGYYYNMVGENCFYFMTKNFDGSEYLYRKQGNIVTKSPNLIDYYGFSGVLFGDSQKIKDDGTFDAVQLGVYYGDVLLSLDYLNTTFLVDISDNYFYYMDAVSVNDTGAIYAQDDYGNIYLIKRTDVAEHIKSQIPTPTPNFTGEFEYNGSLFYAENGKVNLEYKSTKSGWQLENNKWAYYENGIKITNKWVKDSQGWCYLGADGYCVTNCWKADSKGWCYLDANGRMVINNWVYSGGKWYFMDSNGYMVSNCWKKDSKGWCYLGSSGAMLTNAWVKDSVGWCYVGADGYCVTNKWVKDSKGWCYLDSQGRMVYNKWVKDSVGWCYVGSSGYMVTSQWVKYNNQWYYLDGNGYMVTGTKKIGNKTYKFNSSGVWIG